MTCSSGHSPPTAFHASPRAIVYKTSPFRPQEVDGIEEALAEAHVRLSDMVWVSEDSEFRLCRVGTYPPLRGTCLELKKGALLYCRGSIPYYRSYPGLYVRSRFCCVLMPTADQRSTNLAGNVSAFEYELELYAIQRIIANHAAGFTRGRPRSPACVGRFVRGGRISTLHLEEFRVICGDAGRPLGITGINLRPLAILRDARRCALSCIPTLRKYRSVNSGEVEDCTEQRPRLH